jgi:magnesium transporter
LAYVSQLIGKPVVEVDGERVGRLIDLIASLGREASHPEITAIVVRSSGKTLTIAFSDVAVFAVPMILLNRRPGDLSSFKPGEREFYLVRDVLDKQIIDTNGARVVRVNDLELVHVNSHLYVANVDIGGLGLLRRLGLARIADGIVARFWPGLTRGIISWDGVELLPGDQPMRLKVPGERIADLHPADLAEIISDLSRSESGKLLETLDVKTLAEALEEVEPDFQASLVEEMPDEKVADVLEEMAPDEAADLLAELPRDRSLELLKLMEQDDAEDVRRLLAYPDDTAGGIMTTEFIAVDPDLTAEQAINRLREDADEAETVYYIYVTDRDDRLLGVFSLRELVLARPDTPVAHFMNSRVISVNLGDRQDQVAQIVSKYNLLAVPVVDEQQRLQGIVTADDALDKIIPTAWKKRLPRLYH